MLNVNPFQTGSEVELGAQLFGLLVSDKCDVSAALSPNFHKFVTEIIARPLLVVAVACLCSGTGYMHARIIARQNALVIEHWIFWETLIYNV